MDNRYIEIIKGTPLFGGMGDEEIARFLRPDGSWIKSFRKDSYIFHAGDKTAYFGILLEGKALIERDELWGDRSIIAPLEAGQLFGEVYACTGEPLGVSVCAKEQCAVLFLSPEFIIKESSALTARLLRITAMKNLRLNEKIQFITPRTIRERVMAYLSSLVKKSGSHKVTTEFDRQQLADFLCVDRSALSAELGKMRREGLIDFKGRDFILPANCSCGL